MNYAIIVAVVVGIVNLVALGVVAWQTYLTRKSVQLSQEELLESQHASLIANLPKAYSVIDVQNSLHGWKEDLELLISRESQLRDLIKSANCDGKFEFRYWHGSPEGLIDKKSYDYLPDWLQHIQMAGVRH